MLALLLWELNLVGCFFFYLVYMDGKCVDRRGGQ